MKIGTFEDVTAVAVCRDCVSVVEDYDTEWVISITTDKSKPFLVSGEFGNLDQVVQGGLLRQVDIRDVREVHISQPHPARDHSFTTQLLSIRCRNGDVFEWELFSHITDQVAA